MEAGIDEPRRLEGTALPQLPPATFGPAAPPPRHLAQPPASSYSRAHLCLHLSKLPLIKRRNSPGLTGSKKINGFKGAVIMKILLQLAVTECQ